MSEIFAKILFDAAPQMPRRLQTEKKKEFLNTNFETLLKLNTMQHFSGKIYQMAAFAERFNQNIKRLMWIYLRDMFTVNLVDVS